MGRSKMGEIAMLARFRLHRVRLNRFEALNNVGYMLATLASSHGLLSYSFFQELLGSNALFRPTVIAATVGLLAFFALRLTGLTVEPLTSLFLAHEAGKIPWKNRMSSQ
jgi:hypothetical protein